MFCFAPWIGYTRNKAPLFCTKLNEESYLNGCEPGAGSVSSSAMLRVHRASLIQLSSLWTSCRGLEDTICSYSTLMVSWSPLNIEPRSPSPQILPSPPFIKSPLRTDWRWNRLETDFILWSSGKGKGKGSTQEGHSKVIYRLKMVDGGYPFPDALH